MPRSWSTWDDGCAYCWLAISATMRETHVGRWSRSLAPRQIAVTNRRAGGLGSALAAQTCLPRRLKSDEQAGRNGRMTGSDHIWYTFLPHGQPQQFRLLFLRHGPSGLYYFDVAMQTCSKVIMQRVSWHYLKLVQQPNTCWVALCVTAFRFHSIPLANAAQCPRFSPLVQRSAMEPVRLRRVCGGSPDV